MAHARCWLSSALVVVCSAFILSACSTATPTASPTSEAPTTAQDVLNRTIAAMAKVDSYRFHVDDTQQSTRLGKTTTTSYSFNGERGPGPAVHETRLNQDPLAPGYELIAVGRMGYTRVGPPVEWKEAPEFTDAASAAPPIDKLANMVPTSISVERGSDGQGVYVVHGAIPTQTFHDMEISLTVDEAVDVTVSPDTFHVLDLKLVETDTQDDPASNTLVTTSDYTFSDYGADIQIQAPSQFIPAQYATYLFALDGDAPDLPALNQAVLGRLSDFGATDVLGFYPEPGQYAVRLVGATPPAERVAARVTPTGAVDIHVRRCATDCSDVALQDSPTIVINDDIAGARVGAPHPISVDSPVAIGLTPEGASKLAAAIQQVPTDAIAKLVLYLDGQPILTGPAEVGGSVSMSGAFGSVEQLEDTVAVIEGGRLPPGIGLTFAGYGLRSSPTPTPTIP